MSRCAVCTQTWQRPKCSCILSAAHWPKWFLTYFFSLVPVLLIPTKWLLLSLTELFFFFIPLLQPKQSRIWEKSSSTSQKILSLVRAKTCSTAAEGMGLTRITSPLSLSMNVLLSHQDSLKRLLFKFHTFCAIHSPLTYRFVFVLNCQLARNAGRGRV